MAKIKKINKKASLNPTEVYKITDGQRKIKKKTFLSKECFL